ncbi:hypothetical protein GUITHDRAFT_135736 [Guillardia theta CCMP2712]|uniref:Uncharacterized protein n=1 Tax=Guillardia theta (strain CCMP2712) TaxID=905079 RepID=L1JNN2_GUITC|nr:hypothetical protein GUITHDRAFT_135736 [Guillardia theta CCMP2712]EKX50072.1 hypothetical protein GUITHDRAFT_135736 [Guillardia theta CCMP2712]|eukprot:XP_005837052.1 hypothetical protein GUITHDRAFT_135736 [Guillardia theta CCMP2712]
MASHQASLLKKSITILLLSLVIDGCVHSRESRRSVSRCVPALALGTNRPLSPFLNQIAKDEMITRRNYVNNDVFLLNRLRGGKKKNASEQDPQDPSFLGSRIEKKSVKKRRNAGNNDVIDHEAIPENEKPQTISSEGRPTKKKHSKTSDHKITTKSGLGETPSVKAEKKQKKQKDKEEKMNDSGKPSIKNEAANLEVAASGKKKANKEKEEKKIKEEKKEKLVVKENPHRIDEDAACPQVTTAGEKNADNLEMPGKEGGMKGMAGSRSIKIAAKAPKQNKSSSKKNPATTQDDLVQPLAPAKRMVLGNGVLKHSTRHGEGQQADRGHLYTAAESHINPRPRILSFIASIRYMEDRQPVTSGPNMLAADMGSRRLNEHSGRSFRKVKVKLKRMNT